MCGDAWVIILYLFKELLEIADIADASIHEFINFVSVGIEDDAAAQLGEEVEVGGEELGPVLKGYADHIL